VHDCVDVIGRIKSFDISSGLDALEVANKLAPAEAEILKDRALKFIVANFEEVAKVERFHKLVGTAIFYEIISAVYKVVKEALN
jgi:hypothetical protein